MLKDTFGQFGVHKEIQPADVDNFLVDYNVRHSGDLTRQDFAGIKLIRFTTKQSGVNNAVNVNNGNMGVHVNENNYNNNINNQFNNNNGHRQY